MKDNDMSFLSFYNSSHVKNFWVIVSQNDKQWQNFVSLMDMYHSKKIRITKFPENIASHSDWQYQVIVSPACILSVSD